MVPTRTLALVLQFACLASASAQTGVGEVVAELKGHTKSVTALAFVPGTRQAISGSEDRTMLLWDLEAGQIIRKFDGKQNNFVSVAISQNGKLAYTCSSTLDGALIVWDLESGKESQRLEPKEKNSFSALAISAKGKRLLAAGLSTTYLFELPKGKQLGAFKPASGLSPFLGGGIMQTDIAMSTDERFAYVCEPGASSVVRVYDATSGKFTRTIGNPAKTGTWLCARFTPDARFLITGSGGVTTIQRPDAITAVIDFSVRLWEVRTGKLLRTLTGHRGNVRSVTLSNDGKRALSASDDKTLILWNAETGKEIARHSDESASVSQIAFSTDGSHALVGSKSGSVRWIKLQSESGN